MKSKTTKTLKALKKVLKKTLPEKILKVMNSYENFSEQQEPDDAKGFNAYHSALKSAVTHAETLLKLARWTDDEEKTQSTEENLELIKFLKEAEALKSLEGEDNEEA